MSIKQEKNNNIFYLKNIDGKTILEQLSIVINNNPDNNYRIDISYNFSAELCKFAINTVTLHGTQNIYENTERWLYEKGEIYENTDPLKIKILSAKITVEKDKVAKQSTVLTEELDNNTEYLKDTLLITYDTEWNWHDVNDKIFKGDRKDRLLSVYYPDLLTFTVVDGKSFVKHVTDKNSAHEYKTETKVIKGKDCIEIFIQTVLDKRKQYSNKKIYLVAQYAAGVEHIFIVNAITRYLQDRSSYCLSFENDGENRIAGFTWENLNFRDSKLFTYLSLKDAGKLFKVKQPKIDMTEETILAIDWSNPDSTSMQYAIIDSQSLMHICLQYSLFISELLETEQIINPFKFYSGSSLLKNYLFQDCKELKKSDIALFNTDYRYRKYSLKSTQHSSNIDSHNSIYVIKNILIGSSIDYVPGKIVKKYKLDSLKDLDSILNTKYCRYICLEIESVDSINYNTVIYMYTETNGVKRKYLSFWCFEYIEIKDYIESLKFYSIQVTEFELTNTVTAKIKNLTKTDRHLNIEQRNIINNTVSQTIQKLIKLRSKNKIFITKGAATKRIKKKYSNLTESKGPNGSKQIIVDSVMLDSTAHVSSYIESIYHIAVFKEIKRLEQFENASILRYNIDYIVFKDSVKKLNYYKDYYDNKQDWYYELEHTDRYISLVREYKNINRLKVKKDSYKKIWSITSTGYITYQESFKDIYI